LTARDRDVHEALSIQCAAAPALGDSIATLTGTDLYLRRMRAALWLLLLPLVACGTPRYATVGGHPVERPSIGYSDGLRFAIEHERAFPDVLSGAHAATVDDGRITGRACGIDLDFDAAWHGASVELTGRADVPWHRDFTETEGIFGLSLEIVEPAPGRRHMVGRVTGKVSRNVDIDASPERLVATINRRVYTLAADGDFLVGRMRDFRSQHVGEPPREIELPFNIYGRQALATMLPADEAIVLFFMLTCNGLTMERGGQVVNGFSMVRLPAPNP
jgi:hypothetical protein